MKIGASQATDYRKDYAGYSTTNDKSKNEFYDRLSSELEKSGSDKTEKRSDSEENTDIISTDKNDLLAAIHSRISEIAEKVENGNTEPSYQIGGQSFNAKEWSELIEKIDKNIEQIQADQEEREEKQQKEKILTKELEYELKYKSLAEDKEESGN